MVESQPEGRERNAFQRVCFPSSSSELPADPLACHSMSSVLDKCAPQPPVSPPGPTAPGGGGVGRWPPHAAGPARRPLPVWREPVSPGGASRATGKVWFFLRTKVEPRGWGEGGGRGLTPGLAGELLWASGSYSARTTPSLVPVPWATCRGSRASLNCRLPAR